MISPTFDRIAVFSDDAALCNCLTESIPQRTAQGIVVIDWRLVGALRLCAELDAAGTKGVVLVEVPDTVEAGVAALNAGARGIVYHSQPPGDVRRAVEMVANGLVFAPRHVVMASWLKLKAEVNRHQVMSAPDLAERLSDREREVFRYAAAGLSNKELSSRLMITEATVKVHLTHIFQKLGVRGRSELAAAYFGLIHQLYDDPLIER